MVDVRRWLASRFESGFLPRLASQWDCGLLPGLASRFESGVRLWLGPRYNFGVYHWRRRLARLASGTLGLAAGAAALRSDRPLRRWVGVGLLAAGGLVASRPLRKLAASPPWSIDRGTYAALADVTPLDSADVVVDVGCGTGRSLVGLAPTVGPAATVVGLDVFDDRVILGNAPALARRNAARDGQRVTPVRGDAARLPFADGAVDVVTLCRVLHDLPLAGAVRALAESRRVLAPDGTVGVLELPIPHDDGADPGQYWRDLLADAGFDVVECRRLDGEYFVLAGTPSVEGGT